jgi:NADH:ubiquinone oxidoreductase subunit 6 (subunit J)
VGRLPGAVLVACLTSVMIRAIVGTTWHSVAPGTPASTTYGIGNAFLGDYILPFELASVVLLAALIGAVFLSRKELKEG